MRFARPAGAPRASLRGNQRARAGADGCPAQRTHTHTRARSDKPITGVSTYNVVPSPAALHFNKIQCFCFEEQRLRPGEAVDMPVFFYIDPELATDFNCRCVFVWLCVACVLRACACVVCVRVCGVCLCACVALCACACWSEPRPDGGAPRLPPPLTPPALPRSNVHDITLSYMFYKVDDADATNTDDASPVRVHTWTSGPLPDNIKPPPGGAPPLGVAGAGAGAAAGAGGAAAGSPVAAAAPKAG